MNATRTGGWVLLAALALAGAVGCSGTGPDERSLPVVVQRFNEHVRWGAVSPASARVAPEYRAEWLASRAGMERVRLTEIHVLNAQPTSPQEQEVDVIVRVVWHRVDETTVRESTWKQRWRDSKDGWMLHGESRVEAPVAAPPSGSWP